MNMIGKEHIALIETPPHHYNFFPRDPIIEKIFG
jgi:hypothetical protein